MKSISDKLWFNANFNPTAGRRELGIRIPDLPPTEIQLRFTGRQGRANLKQAFEFYKFILKHMPQESNGRLRLIDFGGGWGRILRFFLREFPADRLVLFDCLTAAVECARSLNPPYSVQQNGIVPPLALDKACADCCYAFSVFSHLNEHACLNWLSHLNEILVPGGKLIFTTRGMSHIRNLKNVYSDIGFYSPFRKLLRWAKKIEQHPFNTLLPHLDEIEHLYITGKFQFYPTGGGGELTNNFFGETWITEHWINDNYQPLGFSNYNFFKEFGTVDQCVFILTK